MFLPRTSFFSGSPSVVLFFLIVSFKFICLHGVSFVNSHIAAGSQTGVKNSLSIRRSTCCSERSQLFFFFLLSFFKNWRLACLLFLHCGFFFGENYWDWAWDFALPHKIGSTMQLTNTEVTALWECACLHWAF